MDCARCGGPNSPGATVCQWCSHPLAVSPAPAPPSLEYQPLDVPNVAPAGTQSPVLYYWAGIPLILSGVIALGAAAVIAQGVASYNQTCAQIPNCVPQSDPSGAVAGLGVLLLLIGIFLIVYGATRGRTDPGM